MQGRGAEIEDDLGDVQGTNAGEHVLIGASQVMERHEISRYSQPQGWREEIRLRRGGGLLSKMPDGEKRTDASLREIASALAYE